MPFTIHHEYLRKGINNTTTGGNEKPRWFIQLGSFSPECRYSANTVSSRNYNTMHNTLSLTINYFDFKGLQGVYVWYTYSRYIVSKASQLYYKRTNAIKNTSARTVKKKPQNQKPTQTQPPPTTKKKNPSLFNSLVFYLQKINKEYTTRCFRSTQTTAKLWRKCL